MTPKRNYVSFSLSKKKAKEFLIPGNNYDVWTSLRFNYDNILGILFETKCPKYHLSIYDFIYILSKLDYEGEYIDDFIPNKYNRLFTEFNFMDMEFNFNRNEQEILVFKSIPLKISHTKKIS